MTCVCSIICSEFWPRNRGRKVRISLRWKPRFWGSPEFPGVAVSDISRGPTIPQNQPNNTNKHERMWLLAETSIKHRENVVYEKQLPKGICADHPFGDLNLWEIPGER